MLYYWMSRVGPTLTARIGDLIDLNFEKMNEYFVRKIILIRKF